MEEQEHPNLIFQRYWDYYRSLGYEPEWIDLRLRSRTERDLLTKEWKARGIKKGRHFAILSSIVSKETFGLKPSEHKNLKGLKRENLRDHMTSLELIFTILGEESTRESATEIDAQGYEQNKDAAERGGKIAGKTLKAFEEISGRKVLSSKNFKSELAAAKALDRKRLKDKD